VVAIVVSKSLAETVSWVWSNSNKKLSKIGKVFGYSYGSENEP